jgi:exodeoxyribonuclease-3
VKIATFNVNNINKRLPNLLAWLKSSQPDIACLQEIKSTDAAFPADALSSAATGPSGVTGVVSRRRSAS